MSDRRGGNERQAPRAPVRRARATLISAGGAKVPSGTCNRSLKPASGRRFGSIHVQTPIRTKKYSPGKIVTVETAMVVPTCVTMFSGRFNTRLRSLAAIQITLRAIPHPNGAQIGAPATNTLGSVGSL